MSTALFSKGDKVQSRESDRILALGKVEKVITQVKKIIEDTNT